MGMLMVGQPTPYATRSVRKSTMLLTAEQKRESAALNAPTLGAYWVEVARQAAMLMVGQPTPFATRSARKSKILLTADQKRESAAMTAPTPNGYLQRLNSLKIDFFWLFFFLAYGVVLAEDCGVPTPHQYWLLIYFFLFQ